MPVTIKQRIKRLLMILAFIGPGIIAAAVGNDAGGITTYSVAGAHFGYGIVWVMIPATIVLIIVQEMCSRMGVVTGKGLSDLIRESYGVRVTFYILIALSVANIATAISEFSGVASSLEIFNIPRYVSVPISAGLVWLVITRGNYQTAERVFLAAALIYITYIISGFLAVPDWMQVAKEVATPHIEWNKDYITIVVGIIGTTIAPWMQFYLQSSVVEKGLKIQQYKYTRFDVIIGSILSSTIAVFIMIAAAATLYLHGVRIESASDAAQALAPFAGNFAETLFAIGLLNASLLGAMIVPLATAYYICEGLGFEAGIGKSFKEAPIFGGIFAAIIVLSAVPAMFPGTPLVKIMLVAQVISGVLLAPVLIFILFLVNKKWLMGEHVNKLWYNIVAWFTVSVLIVLSGFLILTTLKPDLF
ncbi:Nramp family divalent metal transporter [Candidatus Gracilibacteria bacterium]|nr:Nramp family divalent metal transporter [Candidatus Gracilibacteria bacterium]